MVFLKSVRSATRTPGQLDAMEAAGRIVGQALLAVQAAAVPGVSTLELDALAESVIRDAGAVPSFKGYHGFPRFHLRIPQRNRRPWHPPTQHHSQRGGPPLIDCGAILDGWHGDSALTVEIGAVDARRCCTQPSDSRRSCCRYRSMVPGNRLGDISHAIEVATKEASAAMATRSPS
ncbi:MAG: M24 family metallopeptidase [Lawsonella clevelandensis]